MLEASPLHYFSYYSTSVDPQTGTWGPGTKYLSGIQGGSPLALYDSNLNTIIISPLDHFMSGIQTLSKNLKGNLACGIQGKIASIPQGHTHSTIIALSQGVNDAFDLWGSLLLKFHGKTPKTEDDDLTLKYLGYWTDNGAFYYYNTEAGKNYEDTMVDVYNYITSINLPVHYYQFDSWWYYRGKTNGLVLWEPKPDIFPNGMKALTSQMGNKPIVLHNRWFEDDTDYYTQLHYPFIIQPGFGYPLTEDTYLYLMTKAKDWGLIVYEQDWLAYQFLKIEAIQTDIHLSENWLINMNKAAQQLGLTIEVTLKQNRKFLIHKDLHTISI